MIYCCFRQKRKKSIRSVNVFDVLRKEWTIIIQIDYFVHVSKQGDFVKNCN